MRLFRPTLFLATALVSADEDSPGRALDYAVETTWALLARRPRRIKSASNSKIFFQKRRSELNVRATTVTDSGQIIDWIDPIALLPEGSSLAEPPEPTARRLGDADDGGATGRSLLKLHNQPHAMGPEGTVPVLRRDTLVSLLSDDELPSSVDDLLSKYGNRNYVPIDHLRKHGRARKRNSTRQHHRQLQVGFPHKYGSTSQVVPNFGSQAYLNTWDPYVVSPEVSLAQGSIAGGTVLQTIECGWMESYWYKDSHPHLFIYYTTNAYAIYGDNLGGIDLNVAGFVQVSKTIFPGARITDIGSRWSKYGGAQYDMQVKFLLDNGNWWIWVYDQRLGYYPAQLFAAQPDGLAMGGSIVNWYGELIDKPDGRPTRTWMGSGHFANKGFGYAAYVRNIYTFRTDCKCLVNFYPTYVGITDSNCYSLAPFYNSTGSFGSHFFYGGPGAYNNKKCVKE